jgi:hypothetical protein
MTSKRDRRKYAERLGIPRLLSLVNAFRRAGDLPGEHQLRVRLADHMRLHNRLDEWNDVQPQRCCLVYLMGQIPSITGMLRDYLVEIRTLAGQSIPLPLLDESASLLVIADNKTIEGELVPPAVMVDSPKERFFSDVSFPPGPLGFSSEQVVDRILERYGDLQDCNGLLSIVCEVNKDRIDLEQKGMYVPFKLLWQISKIEKRVDTKMVAIEMDDKGCLTDTCGPLVNRIKDDDIDLSRFIECENCADVVWMRRNSRKYCSPNCRQLARRKWKALDEHSKLVQDLKEEERKLKKQREVKAHGLIPKQEQIIRRKREALKSFEMAMNNDHTAACAGQTKKQLRLKNTKSRS